MFAGSATVTEYHIGCTDTNGQHIVGLHGSYNSSAHAIDSIGLNFMKEVIQA